MSVHSIPDQSKLRFFWFDYVKTSANTPYDKRMQDLEQFPLESSIVVKLLPQVINSTEELDAFEADCLRDGFEGVMLRSPSGRYKFGRSTLKEAILLKLKRFEDAEAQIIGFEELNHNMNESKTDLVGASKRSSHKANKVAGNTLGAFSVMNKAGVVFGIGTGMTAAQRLEFWEGRDALLGKLVKYKFMPHGVKDAPRHPVFLGFRDACDL